MLQKCDHLFYSLTKLNNLSIKDNVIPEVLKISKVIRVDQKCRDDPSNYGPFLKAYIFQN
jgi:hypothetical protein